MTDDVRSPVLRVSGLKTYFYTDEGVVKAVDGVSFDLAPGEVLGIVGESGSGKTVCSLSVLGLIPASGKVVDGAIEFAGRDLRALSDREMQKVRGNEIAMIFQDPLTALNPVFTIGDQIAEAVQLHQGADYRSAMELAVELLDRVGIPEAESRAEEYPHQLSGGMRQRAMIAMALSCRPRVLIADEPTTALDVTIQAQILTLMNDLRRDLGTSIIIITHDLGVVAEMADTVMVMYGGRAVEYGSVDSVFERPRHPYTWGLLRSLPRLDERAETLPSIPGVPPSLIFLPEGCHFAPRCGFRREICMSDYPELRSIDDGHLSACHFAEVFAEPKEEVSA